MICKRCREAGQRSIVKILGTSQTQMEKDVYFDEGGVEHSHNPNIVTTRYRCTSGHVFQERSSWQCHCGYMAMKSIVEEIGDHP